MIDLDELERRSQCALGFQRYEEAALIAAVRALATLVAIVNQDLDFATGCGCCADEQADKRIKDAALNGQAALAPFRKEKSDG